MFHFVKLNLYGGLTCLVFVGMMQTNVIQLKIKGFFLGLRQGKSRVKEN